MATHSSPLAWKIPWTESLVDCSPWGRKESDTTEQFHFHFHFSYILHMIISIGQRLVIIIPLKLSLREVK